VALIPRLRVRVSSPDYLDRLVVWWTTWGDLMPESASREFLEIMREAWTVETTGRVLPDVLPPT
jgi:hypothetical protein